MQHHPRHSPATDSTVPTDAPRPFSHDEIAPHARELWLQQGSPADRDEAIWLEAESRLRATHEGASGKLPAVGSVQ